MPKVSAVMALYNTPCNYLSKTVESILNQTFSDFELIIIDDASSIEYETFFKNFNDERIKYFKLEKNSGPGHARNEGIKKAQGEYIAIVDSDDIYYEKRFEIQSDFLDNNSEISLISGAFKQSNNGKIPDIVGDNEDIKLLLLFNSPLANPLVMFRKSVFAGKNLFYPENINFAEDYELWVNAMFSNIKFANLKDILMIYTRRKGQLSKEKADIQKSILKNIYKKILSNIGLNPTQEEIELHYNIYTKDFNSINQEQIQNWFEKFIEHNKKNQIFNEQKLIEMRNKTLNDFEKVKNRLFKIKIGKNNLCLSKNFKIYIEQRT